MLASYFKLFKNRDYANLWIGQAASVLGDSVYHVAFYWLAYQFSSSPIIAGVVVFAGSAPYICFGLIGGVYADRLARKKVMIAGDVIRAMTVAVVPLMSLASMLSVPVVAVVALILTSVRCFFYPAAKSAVADILREDDERRLGSSFLQASLQAAKLFGVALGGIMIGEFSAPLVYFIAVLTYAISIVFLLPIKSISEPCSRVVPLGIVADIIDTVNFIRPIRDLFWSIALFGFGLLLVTGTDRVALPALSDKIWNVGPNGLGMMLATYAIGNVLASLALGNVKIERFARMIFIGWGLWGLFYALIGIQSFFSVALSFSFLAGASQAMVDVPLVILIQTSVPRNRMGKVFSMWSTVAFIGEAGSALLIGFVVSAVGPAAAYYAAGVGLAIVASLGLFLTRPIPAIIDTRQTS